MKKKGKILMAMSGGVDSSVAAALLVKKGYDVTGVFVVNYQASLQELRLTGSENQLAGRSKAEPCWRGDYQDALRVAAKLGIPLLRWDFIKEYKAKVLDYMYAEYRLGRTPNPDVLCNKFIKFGAWIEKAKKEGYTKLATGHYASLCELKSKSEKDKRFKLMCAKDDNKDQTYFLHQLNQEQLCYTLFPLGKYLKSEVRSLAKKFALPTAEKEESMGICFVGEVPMKDFLQKEIKIKKGEIILSDGTVVGEHDGLSFYTIGQRIGVTPVKTGVQTLDSRIRGNDSAPFYVVDKNTEKNQLIIGYENDPLLYKKSIIVSETNWVSGLEPKLPLKCEVRLRHRQELQKVTVAKEGNSLLLKFTKAQRAATPGQFAVLYLKGECLGGGVIS